MRSPVLVRQSTETELRAFDSTCDRLGGFDAALSFEWIDGFLAAVAAGPRVCEPGVWLPAMLGDTFDRVFADPSDHAQALRSLQTRLGVLREQLNPEALFDDPDTLRLEPLAAAYTDADRERLVADAGMTLEDAAAVQTGALWAQGFCDGVEALPEVWTASETEEQAELFGEAFDHIHALVLPVDGDDYRAHMAKYYPSSALQPDGPTRDDLLSQACMAVQDLRLFWIDFAPRPATRSVEPKPGRNDPCPCGSGKKFKKCHGA